MPIPEGIPTARMQFKLESEKIPWIYASLMNQPQVTLYESSFPDPFTELVYQIGLNQGQLLLVASLSVGQEFQSRFGETVGSPEDLDLFLKRYQKHRFEPPYHGLVIFDGDQPSGVIGRPKEDLIVIQRGGQAGQLTLGEDPINNLSLHLDRFNVLIQRYVSSIWKASAETDHKEFNLILNVPNLPEGAPSTYFSTFEIICQEFRARPRPVDLDTEIGGYTKAKQLMRSLVMDLTQPEVSRQFGTQPFSNKFALVTGSEGTGKSLFPKALDSMLRAIYGDRLEHYRFGFTDLLPTRGSYSATVVRTILDHIRENEKKGIPTLLHLDDLEELIPPTQRQKIRTGNVFSSQAVDNRLTAMSDAEFQYSLQVLNPVIQTIRDFGRDLGGECHWVIIYGESRVPRDELPEGISRTFRRSVSLDSPSVVDLSDILRVQINTTRKFAERTDHDPFVEGIDERLDSLAPYAIGLNGRDIQQALLGITDRHKAEWDGQNNMLITEDEIMKEFGEMRTGRGFRSHSQRQLGFTSMGRV